MIVNERHSDPVTVDNWSYVESMKFMKRTDWDWKEVRSPIGFLIEKEHFTTFFTTYKKNTDFAPIRKMEFTIGETSITN